MPVTSKGNRSFAVKRSTAGLGLFALEMIPAGKPIIEYVGELLSNREADERGGKYLFAIDNKYTLDGRQRSNTARYINHSCRPNAQAFSFGRRIWIWSKKNIRAGEEITINYGKQYIDQHIKPKGCKCARCIERSGKPAQVKGKKGGRR